MQAANRSHLYVIGMFFLMISHSGKCGTKEGVSLVDQLPIFTQQDVADFHRMQNVIQQATDAFVSDIRNGFIPKAPADGLARVVEDRLMAPVDIKQRVFEQVVRILELPEYLRDVEQLQVGLNAISSDLTGMKNFPADWYRSIVYQLYLTAAYALIVKQTADSIAENVQPNNINQVLLSLVIRPLNELVATWFDQLTAQDFASRFSRDVFKALAQDSRLTSAQKNELFNVHNTLYAAEHPLYRLTDDDINYIAGLANQ